MKKIILLLGLLACSNVSSEEAKPWPGVKSLIYTYYETLNLDYANKTYKHCLALTQLGVEIGAEYKKKIETPEEERELREMLGPNSPDMILQRKLILKVGDLGGERPFEEVGEIFQDYYVWIFSSPLFSEEAIPKLESLTDDMAMCHAFSSKL